MVTIQVGHWSRTPLTQSRVFAEEQNLWRTWMRGTNFKLSSIEVKRLLHHIVFNHPELRNWENALSDDPDPIVQLRESGSLPPEEELGHGPRQVGRTPELQRSDGVDDSTIALSFEHEGALNLPGEERRTAVADAKKLTLWFATNRDVAPANGIFFSGRRSEQSVVHYGKCVVSVPKGHRFGSTGSQWWKRLLKGDDRLKVEGIEPLLSRAYFEQLRDHISQASDEDFGILFVHGYRVSFVDAAVRTAQLAYDLRAHTASFFSWPSAGETAAYTADEPAALASKSLLREYLQALDDAAGKSGHRLHVIAHSMGNRVLLGALHDLALLGWQPKAVDKIVFAAPDEDRDTFKQTMFALQAIGSGRTLYASNKDKAVAASEILHGYARAGYFPPITVSAGLDTIDASQVDSTFLGHSDFATERPLLNDIFLWLTQGLPPARRPSLQVATTADGAVYWQLT